MLLNNVFVFYQVMYVWTYNKKRFINIKRFDKWHSRSRCQALEQKLWELRVLTGKKHPKIKLQPLQKIQIWTFGSLVHQINSFSEVLKLEKMFQKNEVVTGKTPLFVIGPFCSYHSIFLNIGFWQSSFEWKWCAFNLSGFN